MERLLDPGAWLDKLTRRVAFIGLIGLLVVAIATLVDVLLRWLFNAPIEGYEDVTQLLFAVIIAACFPAGLIQGRNITIRFLGKGLGQRATLWLEALGAITTFVFFAIVAWQIAAFALEESVKNRFTQTLEMPTGPWWWVVAVILLMCVPVQFVIALVKTAGAITGRAPRHAVNEESI
jgi:TRAP-type C4-dicarboxylate transport system permease small subunit